MPSRERELRFWAQMADTYAHKWASSYGDAPNDVWRAVLAKLSDDQIRAGIGRAMAKHVEWPPTPPEFLALCQPCAADVGLPDDDSCYRLACRMAADKRHSGSVSTPDTRAARIIWHAVKQIGVFELTEQTERQSRAHFDRVWPRVLEAAVRGEPLPEIPKALPERSAVLLTPEEREAMHKSVDEKLAAIGLRRARA